MGDERQIPQPNTAYSGIPHEQLKTWTDSGEQGDAEGLSDVWKQMGAGLTEAAENLMVAVFGSQAGWTGQAADAMRSRLQKVAEWSQKTGDSFTKASAAFVSQGESVGTAKTAMPEPVQYDPGQMIKEAASSGNPVRIALLPLDMYNQAQASREAHEQAMQVVAQRDAQLAAAAASIPPFEPPPSIAGEKQAEPPPGGQGMPTGGIRPGPGAGGSAGRGGSAGGSGGGGGGAGFPGGSIPGGGFGDGGSGSGDGGDDQGQTPPNINVPSLPVGSGGGTGTSGFNPGVPGGGANNFGPGGLPQGPSAAGGGGGFNSAFGGGFGPGGAPRPGGGFGPMGPGAAAGAGAGAGGAHGPAGVGGAGGRGAAGAGGRGGAGAGGMGAGRGEGGEDGEHQRPAYLVEPDPDATFGTDQLTAPPVIGG